VKAIVVFAQRPSKSLAVTVAVLSAASVSGVPVIIPVAELMLSPSGRVPHRVREVGVAAGGGARNLEAVRVPTVTVCVGTSAIVVEHESTPVMLPVPAALGTAEVSIQVWQSFVSE
jgi:hypothetical protein